MVRSIGAQPSAAHPTPLTDHFLAALSRAGHRQDSNKLALYDALEADDPAALEPVFHAFFASIPHDWYRKNELAGYEGYYASVVYSAGPWSSSMRAITLPSMPAARQP